MKSEDWWIQSINVIKKIIISWLSTNNKRIFSELLSCLFLLCIRSINSVVSLIWRKEQRTSRLSCCYLKVVGEESYSKNCYQVWNPKYWQWNDGQWTEGKFDRKSIVQFMRDARHPRLYRCRLSLSQWYYAYELHYACCIELDFIKWLYWLTFWGKSWSLWLSSVVS